MTLTPAFRPRQMKDVLQVGVLLIVSLVVIGALWIREVRTAQASGRIDVRQRADPYLSSHGKHVTRAEFESLCLVQRSENAPLLEDPERVKAHLPAGSVYEVLIKGGFVAKRKTNLRGAPSATYLAYAFEMSYRREIESNNGRRIVERRSFGPVRMAKISSTADDMQLHFGAPDQLMFNDIGFPEPRAGIAVGPLESVAQAMLGKGIEAVDECDTSLAMLEQDPLSGQSVRLTYVDGVGVQSVEGLGWPLTGRQLIFLFGQSILPVSVTSRDEATEMSCSRLETSQLIGFSDPSRPPYSGFPVLLQSTVGSEERGCGFQVLRMPNKVVCVRDDITRWTSAETLAAATSMGEIRYDSSGTYVADATLNWSFQDLETYEERLLFEQASRDFQDSPTFTVHYHCTRRDDGISRTR